MFAKFSGGFSEPSRQLTTSESSFHLASSDQPLSDRFFKQFRFAGRAGSQQFTTTDVPDQSGDNLATARNITIGLAPTAFTDSVGGTDFNDYYRFTLSRRATFNMSLTGLTADADVQLLNGSGGLINQSEISGINDEAINMTLDAGTYYLRVYPFSGSTNYTMRVVRTSPSVGFAPSSLLPAEVDLGAIGGSLISDSGSINSNNTVNTYRFSLNTASSVNATLTGLTGDLAFRLIRDANNNGTVEGGEEIIRSQLPGTLDESINLSSLAAGSYYFQVYQFTGGGNYNFNLAASPTTPTLAPSNLLAGEVNLGVLNGVRTYTDSLNSMDTSDIYRFTTTTVGNFNASLNVVNGDINFRLLRDVNGNGIVDGDDEIVRSQRPGIQADTINVSSLVAGNYFLQVYDQSGSGNYTLRMSNDLAGSPSNLLGVEQNVIIGTIPATLIGAIDNNNTTDSYRFSLSQVSTFSANLTGITSDLNIRLVRDFNNNGIADPGEELMRSQLGGTTVESLTRELGPGNYLVQVYQNSGTSSYFLQMSSAVVTRPFNNVYGYGLVDAAAAFALARGMASLPPVSDLGDVDWGADMVKAPEVWAQGATGQNVVVAVIDTGVDYNHEDLNHNIWTNTREIAGNGIDDDGNGFVDDVRGWDFISNDNDAMDLDSHGTHVAGTIAAERNDIGITGIAYNAKIMPVRVLDETGYGDDAVIARGIRYAVDNGANVINLSLGGDFNADIASALDYAASRNVVVVMASGNESANSPGFPAWTALTHGIAVGAVDNTNQIAGFSNSAGNDRMNYVVAPGVGVYSTTPSNTYSTYQGTSMAAPHVAGVAALLRSSFPTLTAAQIENIITASANPNGIRVQA